MQMFNSIFDESPPLKLPQEALQEAFSNPRAKAKAAAWMTDHPNSGLPPAALLSRF
jgi:hypothetical protein